MNRRIVRAKFTTDDGSEYEFDGVGTFQLVKTFIPGEEGVKDHDVSYVSSILSLGASPRG